MKKIVIFTQNLNIGGVQKSSTTLANFLTKFYNVTIVLAEHDKIVSYQLNDNINILRIKTFEFDKIKPDTGKNIFNYRIKKLDSILHNIQPDIVISYEDYHNLILLSTNYKCKKIISVRNSINNLYTKDNKIHLLNSKFYYKMIKKLYPQADKIIAVSDFIKNQIISLTHTHNVITIYNGINRNNNIKSHKNEKPYILNTARMNKRKGQEDLIKAFNIIQDKIKHNLILIGDGETKKDIENLIDILNLKQRITIISSNQSEKYLKECDLFIFPSKSEGFSNAILEAMIYKKNILAYKYDGSDEILFKKNLIPIGNIDTLAEKIFFYLTHKKKNEKNALKLYKRAKEFTLKKTLNTYKKEIDKLCAG